MNGRAAAVLIISVLFRLSFVFKPQVGEQNRVAVYTANDLIKAVETVHGKINFDA
jgi:hypothetical protein